MILWLIAAVEICLFIGMMIMLVTMRRRHDAVDRWTSNLANNLGKLQGAIRDLDDQLTEQYDMIQKNSEKILLTAKQTDFDELKQKHTKLCEEFSCLQEAVKSLMQEDEEAAGEKVRRKILLQELNDEMERQLSMEKSWNDGMASILDYNLKVAAEGSRNE